MIRLQLLPDGGPIYTETDVNATIVEPFNTISAVLFILMLFKSVHSEVKDFGVLHYFGKSSSKFLSYAS